MKTILVFLLSLTIAIVLPNPVWAHGAGSSAGGGGGNGGGGGGGGSSAGGGKGDGSGSAGHGDSTNAGGGKGVGVAHGLSNGPVMSKGRGDGTTHGRGFGFGHASIANPGHHALSGRGSHSQNTSHKGETPDGRSLSHHTHAEHSLAQDHVAHTTKADRAVQVDDDALPSDQQVPADRSVVLNPSPDNDVAIGFQPNQEPNVDHGRTANLATIHLGLEEPIPTPQLQHNQQNPETIPGDPDGFIAQLLQLNHDPQADGGWKLNPDTIHSGFDETVTRGSRSALALNLRSLHLREPDTDDSPVTKFPNRIGLQDWKPASASAELDDDDVIGWRLVPFFGLVLVFLVTKAFSRQGVLRVFGRDTIRQPPNPQLQLIRGDNGQARNLASATNSTSLEAKRLRARVPVRERADRVRRTWPEKGGLVEDNSH